MKPEPFVHQLAICESRKVGRGTRIHAFAHVLPGAQIGVDCTIGDHVHIGDDVKIGDRVRIEPGVKLCGSVCIEYDVFIGPNVTFQALSREAGTAGTEQDAAITLKQEVVVGGNVTLLPGVTIGQGAQVAAGSVVANSVPPHARVAGNPAVIVGYVRAERAITATMQGSEDRAVVGPWSSKVTGVTLHRLPLIHDLRGDLTVGEFSRTIPFSPRRYFMVFNVPSLEVRGEHAHRRCHQFLVCAKGSISIVVDDGRVSEEVLLDSPNLGLHVPPLIWAVQYRFSPEGVLVVFASRLYEPEDYVRDYGEYLRIKRKKWRSSRRHRQ